MLESTEARFRAGSAEFLLHWTWWRLLTCAAMTSGEEPWESMELQMTQYTTSFFFEYGCIGNFSHHLGCRVQGAGFRVQGSGFRVRGLRVTG